MKVVDFCLLMNFSLNLNKQNQGFNIKDYDQKFKTFHCDFDNDLIQIS